MKLYTIYDNAAGTYDVPRAFQSDAVAVRSLDALLNSGQDLIFNRWPENFSLFQIGSFDPVSGLIETLSSPLLVVNLWTLVKPKVSEVA